MHHRRAIGKGLNEYKGAIQKADKYTRNKTYPCLFPGCKQDAIRCHAIPRSSCIEALAENGVLYTRPQSLNSLIGLTAAEDPPDIIKVGVNDASVFKGYCQCHDSRLFAPAETHDVTRRNSMCISLHLRALSVEYCRKIFVSDFFYRLSELESGRNLQAHYKQIAEKNRLFASAFKKLYIDNVFSLMGGSNVDSIEYFIVPFSRNLQISACGCFTPTIDTPYFGLDSTISYNLISYSDMSVLVLTIFKVVEHHLDSYLSNYDIPRDGEKLINDIAFSRCEEPLIAAPLWRSLSEEEKLEVRLALRHPMYRPGKTELRIIKINFNDFVSKLTPEMLRRLPTWSGPH